MDSNYFAQLNQINVNDHVEKKGQFSYLSWPYAVAQLRLADPSAIWEVRRFDGLPYLKTEAGYFVEVAVTVQGVTLSQVHPVLDGKNRPIYEPTAFDINTSLQRCLVKAIALHGLGLYIYAGEDLPEAGGRDEPPKPTSPPAKPATPIGKPSAVASAAQVRSLHRAPDRGDRRRSRQGPRLLQRRVTVGTHLAGSEPLHQITRTTQEGSMSTIVKLAQGSPEWHEHRLRHRNASETPAVLQLSPYMTARQLWLIKTGRAPQPEVTAAMAHGTQLEPLAREAYEQQTGLVMEPLVLTEGEYSASLDGITLEGRLVLEIKCPHSKDSKIIAEAKAGRVPIHIYWQLQHQLLVSGADLAHLYVFDGSSGILLEQQPETSAWDTIRQDWDRFMVLVREDRSPALTEQDTVVRTDPEWIAAAQEYIATKKRADDTTANLDALRQRLIGLARHSSEQGGGVSVSRYWKSGTIDDKRIPELLGVDLNPYRGPEREETRVTVLK